MQSTRESREEARTMSWEGATIEDIERIEAETQAMLEREPKEIDNEWDKHGFKNAQDYHEYREG